MISPLVMIEVALGYIISDIGSLGVNEGSSVNLCTSMQFLLFTFSLISGEVAAYLIYLRS